MMGQSEAKAKKADEIMTLASKRFTDFVAGTEWWHNNEVRTNYSLYEGYQWSEENRQKYEADGIDIFTLNQISPIVDAISGFEIQNRTEVNYQPRLSDDDSRGFRDVVSSAVKYFEQDGFVAEQNSHAFADMLKCGLGATHTTFNYEENPDGEVEVNRIFPAFVMYDTSARKKNLKDANWAARVKVVDNEVIGEEFDDIEEGQGLGDYSFDFTRFYNWYDANLRGGKLSCVIEYEWREKTPIHRVENPFYGAEGDELIDSYKKVAKESYQINLDDRIVTMAPGIYSQFRQDMKALGIYPKSTKQKTYKYYRAMIADGKLAEYEENYSQKGFSIKFMTGKYSETRQCFYGVIRAISEPQRILNESVSDYKGYLSNIPKGGVEIEEDAVSDIKGFLDTYSKAKKVTIYRPGALMQGKVRPKTSSGMPMGMVEMIPQSAQWMLDCVGLTPEFMGQMDSKLMTAQLQGQIIRQGLTVLAVYFDAKSNYMIEHGKILVDCVRIMAENSPGRLIRNVVGQGASKYLPLFLDNIAAEYDVVIGEVAQTPGERQETFNKLVELSDKLMQSKGIDILPIVLRYSPFKKDEVDEIAQMTTPQPQQPDPLQQALLESQVALQNANAKKLTSDAVKINLEALLVQKQLETYDDEKEVELTETMSAAVLNQAKAHQTVNPVRINTGGISE